MASYPCWLTPTRHKSLSGIHSSCTGLLFAYGITNSGKTYTINGEPEEAGVLPRSLDVIFNTIADVQAPKFVSQCRCVPIGLVGPYTTCIYACVCRYFSLMATMATTSPLKKRLLLNSRETDPRSSVQEWGKDYPKNHYWCHKTLDKNLDLDVYLYANWRKNVLLHNIIIWHFSKCQKWCYVV